MKENSSHCFPCCWQSPCMDIRWDFMTVVQECLFSNGFFRMIFSRQSEWQPTTAGGGGGARGERRSLRGRREQRGTGGHSCQRAFPETSHRANGATTLLQLPPGDLSPSADPWKSLWWQVTLAEGGAVSISAGLNLQLDELSRRNTERMCDKMKVTGSHCKCCCRGLAWLLWWRTAVVEGDAPKASSERPSLDLYLFPCFKRISSLQTLHSGSLPDEDVK